jgi:hypothetical protein
MPGQMTPIHDHACWGVMGLVQNSLEEICYDRLDDGKRPDYAELEQSRGTDVGQGGVAYLLPPYEEIHRIGNTSNKPTISLHVYGRDLDEVNVFDPVTGKVCPMRIKYYSPECGKAPFVKPGGRHSTPPPHQPRPHASRFGDWRPRPPASRRS